MNNWLVSCSGSKAFRFTKSPHGTKIALRDWNYLHFGNISTQINKIKAQISAISVAGNQDSNSRLQELNATLSHWYDIEEDF